MAELLGKATGCSKGKGGSMHFFDAEKGFLGGHAIVGSHIPLAAGVAFAIKYRGEDRVCICYFGDGAMDQGSLHEAFNMASALEAAGHLRRREQHDVDGHPAPPALLGRTDLTDPRRDRLRHARRRRSTATTSRLMAKTHPRGRQPRPGRRGADVHRGQDLPLPRPLDERPDEVPHQGRARQGQGARPDRPLRDAPQGARLDRRARRSNELHEKVKHEVDEASSSPSSAPSRRSRRSTRTSPSAPYIPQE